jgi:FecR protein
MRNRKFGMKHCRTAALAGLAGCLLSGSALAAGQTGEALIVAQTGKATVRVFTGPVHEGRTTVKDLFEGASLGESSRIMTGKDGRLCSVLSPGAILCVAPKTELTITQLRHTADGLPQSEEDLVRRIHIDLHKGRIRIQAGTPIPTTDIQITTPDGVVEAQGGGFVVAQDSQKRWNVMNDAYELSVTPRNGTREEMDPDSSARLEINGKKGYPQIDESGRDAELDQFELCNTFFSDLEPFLQHTREFNREGLEQYMGLSSSFVSLDKGGIVSDVSPIVRPDVAETITPGVPLRAAGSDGGRWDKQRIWSWYESIGTVKGVNYVPRTAVNSVEMWMGDSFDPETIDEELNWAQDVGYTCIRVQLQVEVWQQDSEGFIDRVGELLKIAQHNGLRVTLVLFDDMNIAGEPPRPVVPQPEPLPGVHNGRWVPSPSAQAVTDRSQWPELEKYVKDVMGEFKRDSRVLYWDLYNTAGNNGLKEETLPLMDQTFNWARSMDASQPLAVAPWREFNSAMAARKLERSDLVTFQSFDNVESIEARLLMLQRYQRPIICSDWLMRQVGNDFDPVLPLFSLYQVGWFNQGLVKGKTQMQLQQHQFRSETDPDLWQQDVLHEDGTPYNRKEVELIQGFQYLATP